MNDLRVRTRPTRRERLVYALSYLTWMTFRGCLAVGASLLIGTLVTLTWVYTGGPESLGLLVEASDMYGAYVVLLPGLIAAVSAGYCVWRVGAELPSQRTGGAA